MLAQSHPLGLVRTAPNCTFTGLTKVGKSDILADSPQIQVALRLQSQGHGSAAAVGELQKVLRHCSAIFHQHHA